MIGIYKIYNEKNPLKVYIGQSINIQSRKRIHFHELRNNKHCNKHLQNCFNKNGEENIIFEIIKECSKDILNKEEMYFIEKYDSYRNGYNMTLGGESRPSDNPETRKKISKSLTGKKLSKEHIEAIIKGKKNLKVYGICVAQYTMSKKLLKVYLSVNEASRETKVSASILGKILKDEKLYGGGFIWKHITREVYEEQKNKCIITDIPIEFVKSNKGILAIKDNLETFYSTIIKCANDLNINQHTIIRNLKGGVKKSRNGYTFKYK